MNLFLFIKTDFFLIFKCNHYAVSVFVYVNGNVRIFIPFKYIINYIPVYFRPIFVFTGICV